MTLPGRGIKGTPLSSSSGDPGPGLRCTVALLVRGTASRLATPVLQVLALSSVVMISVGLGLGAWNLAYGVRVFSRIRALPEQPEDAA